MTPRHGKPDSDTGSTNTTPDPAETEAAGESTGPNGPGSTIGERITGVRDPNDVDGLLTLDDLDNPNGDVSDLSSLLRRATQYGDQSES